MSAPMVELLRKQLREKFPQAHATAPAVVGRDRAEWPPEFPGGVISEVTGAGPGWTLAALLEQTAGETGAPGMALIDAADSFDPGSFSAEECARLLWVRCRKCAMEMIMAADWVVRDGNMPLVVVDATGLARRELARVPASAWWRLRQEVERTGCRLLVTADAPLAPSAGRRWHLSFTPRLADFLAERRELAAQLRVEHGAGAGRAVSG